MPVPSGTGFHWRQCASRDGKLLVQELRAMAQKGGGWVEYECPRPQTKKIESKISFVRKTEGYDGFVAVGVYRFQRVDSDAEAVPGGADSKVTVDMDPYAQRFQASSTMFGYSGRPRLPL